MRVDCNGERSFQVTSLGPGEGSGSRSPLGAGRSADHTPLPVGEGCKGPLDREAPVGDPTHRWGPGASASGITDGRDRPGAEPERCEAAVAGLEVRQHRRPRGCARRGAEVRATLGFSPGSDRSTTVHIPATGPQASWTPGYLTAVEGMHPGGQLAEQGPRSGKPWLRQQRGQPPVRRRGLYLWSWGRESIYADLPVVYLK